MEKIPKRTVSTNNRKLAGSRVIFYSFRTIPVTYSMLQKLTFCGGVNCQLYTLWTSVLQNNVFLSKWSFGWGKKPLYSTVVCSVVSEQLSPLQNANFFTKGNLHLWEKYQLLHWVRLLCRYFYNRIPWKHGILSWNCSLQQINFWHSNAPAGDSGRTARKTTKQCKPIGVHPVWIIGKKSPSSSITDSWPKLLVAKCKQQVIQLCI